MSTSSPQPLDPWTPLGWALLEYERHPSPDASMFVFMEDGERLPLLTSTFFRPPEELPETEALALDYCRGRVLDLGAGAGTHSLLLQERGFEVTAVDICPQAVEVMQRRGVRQALNEDTFSLAQWPELAGAFDTLLLMMNGIGVVGEVSNLEAFFAAARHLLAPGGQILCDSTDLRAIRDSREQRRMLQRQRLGFYRGETRQRIAYRGLSGAPFGWLYLDIESLNHHAQQWGWLSQTVFESDEGAFLARLSLTD